MSIHSAAEPAAHAHAHPSPHPTPATVDEPRRPWTVFGLMIAAQFMVILDVSVVNVALPSISRALHLSAADHQWTISAYVLLSGGLLLLGGRIADLLNRRGAFLAGIGLFTAASLLSGLAQAPWTLILARAGQGAGAGFLLVGAGVGPMFVAIAIAAMSDVPADRSGLASGLMTGHEIGAALGVAALTAIAGDLTSRAGLITGYGNAFVATAGILAALFLVTALAVPGGRSAVGASAHGHGGHGH